MKGQKGKSGYAAPPKPRQGEFKDVSIALVATRWNVGFVRALLDGAHRCLKEWGVPAAQVKEFLTPGAFELPLAVSTLTRRARYDGIVALGAVIRGETPHFEYVAGECARGLREVAQSSGVPIGFGVLTVNTDAQAAERCGAGKDNKGYEAAASTLEMIRFVRGVG
jgi:6,7-dimethyl-8-ribityllumazine synthase